jgi:hypothetical protein
VGIAAVVVTDMSACTLPPSPLHTLPVRGNLQGEKAASNAGVPFVVVGRKLSAANFRQALIPHLEPNSTEAAALAAAAKEAAAKAAANKAEADAFFRSAVAWKAPRQ